MAEATAAPPSSLIARLASCPDAPTFRGGAVNVNALPKHFATWARVAWGDLLASLPDEDAAPLRAVEPAREEFRRLVRAALLTEVVLGDVIGHEGPTQTERRSIIDWCIRFAKPGPWKAIRSKCCWCRLIEGENGEVFLRVAIRHDLFSQLAGASRQLGEMRANTFTRRAARYGVGTSDRGDRPHGLAAVVLSAEFLSELTAGLPDGEQTEEETPKER